MWRTVRSPKALAKGQCSTMNKTLTSKQHISDLPVPPRLCVSPQRSCSKSLREAKNLQLLSTILNHLSTTKTRKRQISQQKGHNKDQPAEFQRNSKVLAKGQHTSPANRTKLSRLNWRAFLTLRHGFLYFDPTKQKGD
jgi:hypothetical protein